MNGLKHYMYLRMYVCMYVCVYQNLFIHAYTHPKYMHIHIPHTCIYTSQIHAYTHDTQYTTTPTQPCIILLAICSALILVTFGSRTSVRAVLIQASRCVVLLHLRRHCPNIILLNVSILILRNLSMRDSVGPLLNIGVSASFGGKSFEPLDFRAKPGSFCIVFGLVPTGCVRICMYVYVCVYVCVCVYVRKQV